MKNEIRPTSELIAEAFARHAIKTERLETARAWQIIKEDRILRAVTLRKSGLSIRAAASITGLPRGTVAYYCSGIQPDVELPDLPGVAP